MKRAIKPMSLLALGGVVFLAGCGEASRQSPPNPVGPYGGGGVYEMDQQDRYYRQQRREMLWGEPRWQQPQPMIRQPQQEPHPHFPKGYQAPPPPPKPDPPQRQENRQKPDRDEPERLRHK